MESREDDYIKMKDIAVEVAEAIRNCKKLEGCIYLRSGEFDIAADVMGPELPEWANKKRAEAARIRSEEECGACTLGSKERG